MYIKLWEKINAWRAFEAFFVYDLVPMNNLEAFTPTFAEKSCLTWYINISGSNVFSKQYTLWLTEVFFILLPKINYAKVVSNKFSFIISCIVFFSWDKGIQNFNKKQMQLVNLPIPLPQKRFVVLKKCHGFMVQKNFFK